MARGTWVTDQGDWRLPAASDLAHRLLGDHSERLNHSAAVAARAADLTSAVAEREASLLVTAAWLHDIGYAPALQDTGFHPIDGARYLRSTGWDDEVCDLVAHHSGSRFVAAVKGLHSQLEEFCFVECPVSDAMTIADQTIGVNGRSCDLDERMRDMLERHGPDSPNGQAHPRREAYFRSAFQRVTTRLELAGSGDADDLHAGGGLAYASLSSRASSL